jgi:hypothetical protein
MNELHLSEDAGANATPAEILSALFASLVMQQTSMAMMFLGRMAHPQTGQTARDLEAARMFIDQLEMIEEKTKGNLNKDEEQLLKQSLTTLRLAFVEEAGKKPAPPGPEPSQKNEPPPATPETARRETSPIEPAPASPPEEESRKKFSKKY